MSAKAIVCRVSMIPGGDVVSRKAKLLDFIRRSLEGTELQHLDAIKISIVHSCYDSQMFTGLVQFKSGLPEFLRRLKEDPLLTQRFKVENDDIALDQSFPLVVVCVLSLRPGSVRRRQVFSE